MATPDIDDAAIKALAAMTDDDLGDTEEDVKIHFVVPLLHALGHTKLRFEHKGMDIVLKTGLPRGSTVVVETKRPDASLDQHLAQLERYSFEERSLLSVLTNGRLLRVYAPFWNRAATFAETLLWELRRADLADSRHVEALAGVLSRDALAAKTARGALEHRQDTVEYIWEVAQEIRDRHREWRERLERRLAEIDQRIAELHAEQERGELELGEIGPRARDKIRRLFKLAGVPLVAQGEFADAAALESDAVAPPAEPRRSERGAPPKPRGWTEEELLAKATTYQRRVFAAFVRAGEPVLGLKEIAKLSGLKPNQATCATRHFRTRKKKPGDREPLIQLLKTSADERERRGNLFAISPRYWPTIQRLYADLARPAGKPREKRRRKAREGE